MCRKVREPLGKAGSSADNELMSDQQEHKGFQFPGVFEITAMGPAAAGLDLAIPHELVAAGLTVLQETVRSRPSSTGRFVSVTISFQANSRADYDAAHVALRAHPEVKWTL
jgi:putative lipoic acid-binding regulatory protein